MSLIKRIFGSSGPDPRINLIPLYNQIVAHARQPHWYEAGQVPDTLDGRFDMVSAVLSLVLLRLEDVGGRAQDMTHLTEVFIDDMDGQLRESGVGDVIVGKHMGRMMSALGGRLGAFRDAFEEAEGLDDAIVRNIYRGETTDPSALAHVRQKLVNLNQSLGEQPADMIAQGSAVW